MIPLAPVPRLIAAVLLTLGAAACAGEVAPGSRFVGGAGAGPVGDYRVPVRSMAERRFDGIVRQRYDFSCGSAALATLLRYHYDLDVREDLAFRGMWLRGDQPQIRRLGFSLLDMKRWLASRGLRADGYKVTLDKVRQTGVPGIALIAIRDYRHFVVVKGVSAREVLLGDPSSGVTVMPRAAFEQAWNGIYFVLADDQPLAKTRFNREAQWLAYARAPIGGRFSDPVSQQALSITAPSYGDIS
ncbi:C39 family peptidase [Sphingomonas sp. RRHST34]|uniref:C39 family peptidase n=1 Tax=Sphingomonas citri TaxID=2862499 RepID=A0ABS7BP68_9SPHN|nr:C39 family peptidase [Sphingomonas citri]MBW6531252.1 C39 family peptidase [Sphingomonas citri]